MEWMCRQWMMWRLWQALKKRDGGQTWPREQSYNYMRGMSYASLRESYNQVKS